MKQIILFFFCSILLLQTSSLEAQETTQTTKDLFNFGGAQIKSNTVMGASEIAGTGGKVIGTQLLDTTWQQATIKLYQRIGPPGRETDSIPSVAVRYDIYNNDFEVMVSPKDIRGLLGSSVRYFVLRGILPRLFISLREFRSEDNISGFVEVLTSGRASLLQHTQLSVSKPTYNVALSTGSKDTRINKNLTFYYSRNRTIVKLGTSKKRVIEALGDRADDIEKWLKTQDLDLKKATDLAKVFEYYNSL